MAGVETTEVDDRETAPSAYSLHDLKGLGYDGRGVKLELRIFRNWWREAGIVIVSLFIHRDELWATSVSSDIMMIPLPREGALAGPREGLIIALSISLLPDVFAPTESTLNAQLQATLKRRVCTVHGL